ncbi:MAG TPA: DUF167 domain-containing protein [Terriglobia bacterium]|nr:DUF167 domain-containing protein [Terriglobia bacterium]
MKLRVRVIPNAKKTEFSAHRPEYGDEWVLRLNAPPVDGKANKAALEFIAKTLGIARSGVSLVSGEKGRHKIFEIVGLQPSDVERELSQRIS